MQEIKIGTAFSVQTVVNENNTALAVGSGEAAVFATPMMIALMENAAYKCIKPFLEEHESSVGIDIHATHESATPVGLPVTATATVTAVDGKVITFSVEAFDTAGIIGRGEHKRAVVNTFKFVNRCYEKLQ